MPVLMRLRVIWQICDMEWTARPHSIAIIMNFVLLPCESSRFNEVFAFLIVWPKAWALEVMFKRSLRKTTHNRSFHPHPLLPSLSHASRSSRFGRFQVMKFNALVPPSSFPRGHARLRPPSPICGVVWYCQSSGVSRVSPYLPGTFTDCRSKDAGPASSTPTLMDGSSLNRAATTRPAVPPPMIK